MSSVTPAPSAPDESSSKVTAKCKKCKAFIAEVANAWKQITGSYYLVKDSSEPVKTILYEKPPARKSESNNALFDCLCQPLACSECGESLAFRCLDAPESKVHFKDLDFFKLSRVVLFSMPGAERVEPVIAEPLSRPQTASMKDASSVAASPQLASVSPKNSPAAAQPRPTNIDEADAHAVKGTNDGSLSWQLAHENWTLKTKLTLPPMEFGKRILALGGGKNPKPMGFAQGPSNTPGEAGATAPKDRPSSVQESGRMSTFRKAPSFVHDERSSGAEPWQRPWQSRRPSSIGPQRAHQPSPLQQQTNAQQPAPSQQPLSRQPSGDGQNGTWWQAKVGHPYLQLYPLPSGYPDSADLQRRDIETLKMSVDHLQRTVQALSDKLDVIGNKKSIVPKSDSARDDALDALADSVAEVSSKAAKIDGIVVGMDTLKRKVKRLEGTSQVDATPSQANGSRVSFTGENATPSTQQLSQMHSSSASANGVKRHASEDFMHSEAKRLRAEAQPFTPSTTSGYWEAQGPGMLGSKQSTPRRRGRPPKDRNRQVTNLQMSQLGTPQWEHDSWTGSQVDSDGFYRPLQPHVRGVGALIHGAAGYDWNGKKLRRKPVRNEQGFLVKSDGTIDRRTFSSGANLKKIHDKRLSGLTQPSTDSTPVKDAEPNATSAQTSPTPQTTAQSHGRVMSKMFPNGIAADASKLNAAVQLFSDQSPERPKMLMRDEMHRDEVAGGSPASKRADRNAAANNSASPTSPTTGTNAARHVSAQPADAANGLDVNGAQAPRAPMVDGSVERGQSPSDEEYEPMDVSMTNTTRAVPDSHSSVPSGITTPDVFNPPHGLKTADVTDAAGPTNEKPHESQASYKPSQVGTQAYG